MTKFFHYFSAETATPESVAAALERAFIVTQVNKFANPIKKPKPIPRAEKMSIYAAEVRRLAAAGMQRGDAANIIGLSYARICQIAKANGIKFVDFRRRK